MNINIEVYNDNKFYRNSIKIFMYPMITYTYLYILLPIRNKD